MATYGRPSSYDASCTAVAGEERFSAPRMLPPRSAMAITGLVLGIVGLITSVIPIVNNLSFVLGVVGVVFAGIGLAACFRGTRSGKALAIAALVLSIVTIVAVLATQAAMSAAIDQAQKSLEGPAATTEASNLALGSSVTLDNGLVVTVESVTGGFQTYSGNPITEVRVNYRNDGTSEASFNMFDWKAQDAQGVLDSATLFMDSTDPLNSGTLVPGGSVSGAVYFDGDVAKVCYYASLMANGAAATWNVA